MSDSEEPEMIKVELSLFTHLPEKLSKEETIQGEKIVKDILGGYITSAEKKPLVFPKELSADLKKIVHNLAEILHLSHDAKGGKKGAIEVAKKSEYVHISLEEQKVSPDTFVDVPNAVTEVQLDNTTSTSLKLKWKAPDANNSPITMYQVEVSPAGKPINTSVNEVTLSELIPSTIYTIVIRAQNKEGLGYTEEPFCFKTLPDPKQAGGIFSWGLCDNNQLGFNESKDKPGTVEMKVPKPTPVISLGDFVHSIASHNSGAGLLVDGTVFRFGTTFVYNEKEEEKKEIKNYISNGDHENVDQINSEPYQVEFPMVLAGSKTFICQISCGDMFGLALSTSGQVFSWGTNGFCELGIGTAIDCAYSINPVLVKFPTKAFIIKIACGSNHSIVLSKDHRVFVWGKKQAYYFKDYEESVLLDKSVFIKQAEPRALKSTDMEGDPVAVYAGGEACGILNASGELMTFGENDMGTLGIGPKLTGNLHVPKRLDEFHQKTGRKVVDLSIGFAHMLSLVEHPDKSTSVYSWGLNSKGQCGVASAGKCIFTPTRVPGTGIL